MKNNWDYLTYQEIQKARLEEYQVECVEKWLTQAFKGLFGKCV